MSHIMELLPSDAFDENARADERRRRARLAFFASLLSKVLSMLVLFFGMSLTLPYLGVERFGVWMIVASLASCLTFLDLGVGNALTGQVARVLVQGQKSLVRDVISSGIGLLFLIGLASGALLFVVVSLVPWGRVTNVTDPVLLQEMRTGAQVFTVLFGISLLGGGMQRIFAGLQQAHWAHLASATGSLLALIALFGAAHWQLGIPDLLLATFGLQSVLPLILLLHLGCQGLFRLTGLLSVMRQHNKVMLHSGGLFLVLQLGPILGSAIDPLLISSTLGVAAVATFSVVQRLLQLISQPLSLLNAPLWAAYADAQARGDIRFIRRSLARSLLTTVTLALLGAAVVWSARDWVLPFWTKGVVQVPDSFLILFAFWVVFDSVDSAFAMFLNGCNLVVPQLAKVVTFVLLALPLKWFMALEFGLIGIPLAALVAFVFSTGVFYGLVYRRQLLLTLQAGRLD
ncbi:MAG: MATE family efflux transporter [Pseudomonadota bacterium]